MRAHTDNRGRVYLGGPGLTTTNGYELLPGEPMAVDVVSPNTIHAMGAAPDRVSWIAALR